MQPRDSSRLNLTKPMDYLIVFMTAAFIAAYAVIVGRLLPKD